jgi:pimeloyl-ACP methyl ester carboxylesterase
MVILFKILFGPKRHPLDTSVTHFRALPTDCDLNLHLRSSRYIEFMDAATIHFMGQMGILGKLLKRPAVFITAWMLATAALAPLAEAQAPGGNEMCGDGTTFTVPLEGDSVTLPNGCRIYALFVSGYERNRNLDELTFYKVAKFVMENDGYVHWAWWNNLLKEYMAGPLHPGDAITLPLIGTLGPNPGGLLGVHALGFVPSTVLDVVPKAVPEEDVRFQADARTMLAAIRAHNPDAIIVVAGHSMGGDAVARLGANTDVKIDLLAPIDPVGNRSSPVGKLTDRTFNWTRWRATQEVFRGFRRADCVRNPSFPLLCQDFDPRPFHFSFRCTAAGPFLDAPVFPATFAPGICPGPVVDPGTRRGFGRNIIRLYHRWQKEAVFPFDFLADEFFGHWAPLNAGSLTNSFNVQRPVARNALGGSDPNKTCHLGLDPRDPNRLCNPTDGHGEIVGFRAPTPGQPGSGLPVAPLALQARNWPAADAPAERRQKLLEMVSADNSWPHRPIDPNMCMVSDDMVTILQHLVSLQPAPSPQDLTAPTTVATATPGPNDNGWHNDDMVVTLIAQDEPGGSGVREIEFSLAGAQSGGTTRQDGGTVDIVVSAEGDTSITFFARDNAGNVETPKTLTVRLDKTPPVLHGLPDPSCVLWPPNHQLVHVASVSAADVLSGLALGSFSVAGTSNEPETGTGDGRHAPDIVISEGVVQLRAERAGGGSGRTYALTASVRDLADNVAIQTAVCTVPHDRRNR